ncbi:hypothetical protein AAHE18_04G033900 [Arachis hypogaea]
MPISYTTYSTLVQTNKKSYNENSAKIWPVLLSNGYETLLLIPEDSDLRRFSQILKANILLLNHPHGITTYVMNPNIRMGSFIIVIEQALQSTSIAATPTRHISLIYSLTFHPL